VADDLSALADTLLRVTARWCWQRLKNRHREDRSLPSSATASWAARSWATAVTWTSCLCIEDDDERAPEVYAAFVRKLINWLTVKTAEG
jgi:glutamate-ammonia-ligase adenylyltransferase